MYANFIIIIIIFTEKSFTYLLNLRRVVVLLDVYNKPLVFIKLVYVSNIHFM